MSRRPHIAYVVYWGATEWLGESVAVPAAEALTDYADVTLVTFEKPTDATPARVEAMTRRLDGRGVTWRPQVYHKRPSVVSSFLDAWRGGRVLAREHARRPLDLVLARTFVAGLAATGWCRRTGVPLVYYHDACWPEEQIDQGHWAPGSIRYRTARALESRTFRTASGLVTLTQASLARVLREGRIPPDLPTVVAPTVSDVAEAASPDNLRRPGDRAGLRLLYLGTFGGRKPMEPMLRLLEAAEAHAPGSTLRVMADDGLDRLRSAAAAMGLGHAVEVGGVPHDRIGSALPGYDAGLVFLAPGESACCQTPTKVGEYLAWGLPVVCNAAVGDVPALVRDHDVGVVLDDLGPEAAHRAMPELIRLVRDPTLPRRAHEAARGWYSMEAVTAAQVRLMDGILSDRRRR